MPSIESPIRAKRLEDDPDAHYMGIPNRDLTEEDWAALSDDQRARVAESGLWRLKSDEQLQPALDRQQRAAERAAAKAETTSTTEGQA